MPLDTKQYAGMEVRKNFVNRPDFGFLPLDVNPGGGCVYGIDSMYEYYLGDKAKERERAVVDQHLMVWIRCENAWNARTSELEERIVQEERRIEEDEENGKE